LFLPFQGDSNRSRDIIDGRRRNFRCMKMFPRIIAAGWFAVAGFIVPVCWFLPQMIRKFDAINFFVFIVLSSAAAGCAGFLMGHPILDPHRTHPTRQAVGRGILVSLRAIFIYTPVFTAIQVIRSPQPLGIVHVIAIMGLVSVFCVFVAGPLIAIVAATSGWLLYRFGCQQRPSIEHSCRRG